MTEKERDDLLLALFDEIIETRATLENVLTNQLLTLKAINGLEKEEMESAEAFLSGYIELQAKKLESIQKVKEDLLKDYPKNIGQNPLKNN